MQSVPTIRGTTRFIPLIGHPTAQVQSPGPLNTWFADHDADVVMVPVDIVPAGVAAFLDAMRATESCVGISVTMPHKQAAFAHADHVTARAGLARAVNILRRNADGTLTGDMVDGLAMVAALAASGVSVAGKTVLVIGAGGAGSAIVHAVSEAGAGALVVIERDTARLDAVRRQIADGYPGLALHAAPPEDLAVDIAINASPAGMTESDPHPFPLSRLPRVEIVADAVTRPEVTPWLREAERRGIRTQSGVAMTLAQLPAQLEFWGMPPKSKETAQ